ncbi:Rv1733c family protein [Actinacidiphila acidipaludis]|uniref:Integral membrane protein n=1 Tax=Actinacidiphila acidipaludis TaxID=2873382 RepID=A0ABS7Q783_9ACTN|nr:hypothetical protein [Streptomyces acidipaludis]MBY8879022.1 hypothetical protein [Streptomyces acidipaludis]
MRTTVRFWRWRRNALKRCSDCVEAWIVLVAGVLLWLGAPLAGVAAGWTLSAHAPRPGADWHRVTAVAVQSASPVPATGWSAVGTDTGHVQTLVRFTPPGGTPHTAEAPVPVGTLAGAHVPVWVDGHGALHDNPSDPAQIQARAVVFGLMASTVLVLVVLGTRGTVLLVINRRRATALEREWAKVGPRWGHHPA